MEKKNNYELMRDFLKENPSATPYEVDNFAKKHNMSYSSSGGSSANEPDEDDSKFVYSDAEWSKLTRQDTSADVDEYQKPFLGDDKSVDDK